MSELGGRHYLTPLFEPASVAIVGASPSRGKPGEVLVANALAAGYKGKLFGVNPKYADVLGVPCVGSLDKLPQRVDLAVIATPPRTLPRIVDECGRAGIRNAIVVTAGFSETGADGARLEKSMLDHARRQRVRLLGPDCVGILRPVIGLNVTYSRGSAIPGSLAMVSQSGAVCTAMLDWAAPNQIGFSSVISLGGSIDIDFGEIVDYLAYDPKTEHILLYVEGIRDARRFIGSLRAAARVKPVIIMKGGRHPAVSRAAVSYTGAIVGSDEVFESAVRRAGVVRVNSIGQMVAAAQALSVHVRPRGNRLALITNGGAPGVMAADHAADLGLPLAEPGPATLQALRKALPANWTHGNPIDLGGDADAARYAAAVSACLADPGVDGVLAILAPQARTDAESIARAVADTAQGVPKPLLACWMGEQSVGKARKLLQEAHIPVFRTPDPAVEMFAHLSAFYHNQLTLLQAPGPLSHHAAPNLETARSLIDKALSRGRTVLSQAESKQLLTAFHIPVAKSVVVRSVQAALRTAEEIGYPVTLKIDSPYIRRKSDAGGVHLNLADAEALRQAWVSMFETVGRKLPKARAASATVEPMVVRPHARELRVGVLRDKVFGPAITFGAGGIAVEVQGDRSVALPPLNSVLADGLMQRTRVFGMLGRFRNMPPVDIQSLQTVLLRVSEMVCELPAIDELDIDPLIADENGVIALDARVAIRVLPRVRDRYAHMAIHPYPADLISNWRQPDGSTVVLRPIRPEDAVMEQAFVNGLSDDSRRMRFMNSLRELTPAMLARFTQIDYDREMALVAVQETDGGETEIGVTRYVTNPDAESCEFAIVVADAWQGKGLARRLLQALIDIARTRGLKVMEGFVLADNHRMLRFCKSMGFDIAENPEDPTTRATILRLVRPRK